MKKQFQSLLGNKKFTNYVSFAAVSTTIVGALATLYLFNPASSGIYPPSPFRELTGLYCPGCGTLRALHQLLNGHFWTAFGLNPLMIISLPFMVYSYFSYAIKTFTGKYPMEVIISPKLIWFLLQAILAYWVVRNIPFAPFSWLAP